MPALLPRRLLAPLAFSALTVPAAAERAWKPGRDVEIVVGTDPGTGFDRTARVLQAVWKESGLVTGPVTVLNKPGGAGVIGYHYVNERARLVDELAIIAPLLLTNNLTGSTSFSWHDLTPLCVLLGEEIVTAASPAANLRSGRDFVDAIKRDPTSVSVGMSGIGGQNHVSLGLIGEAVGADISKLKVVAFTGSGDAVTAVLGGHVDVVVGPASSVAGLIQANRLIGLGIASETRLGGPLVGVPTWQEQGIPVTFTNWRGVAGAKSMTSQQIAYWDEIFAKTVQLKPWTDELARSQLSDHYLNAAATTAFLAKQEATLRPVLKQLGFAQ
jgi:putative tricarboxylic transport membrane protein